MKQKSYSIYGIIFLIILIGEKLLHLNIEYPWLDFWIFMLVIFTCYNLISVKLEKEYNHTETFLLIIISVITAFLFTILIDFFYIGMITTIAFTSFVLIDSDN